MWIFLAGDAMSFGGLICAYAALRMGDPNWPIPSEHLGIPLTAFMTFLLICSSVTMVKGLEAIQHGDQGRLRMFLGLTVLGGTVFLLCQAYEWTHLIQGSEHHPGLGLSTLFGATFFILTGFHGCHVFSGVVYLTAILLNAGHYTKDNHNSVEIAGLYWHFVDLVWILIFTFVYLI
jgi:heme/copper-type cytochrome/quinol oxidase subunit 3